MTVKMANQGVGYFDTLFSALDTEVFAETLKQSVLKNNITEASNHGEVLNNFVSTLIQSIDYSTYKKLAPQFFSYPKTYEEVLEVTSINSTEEELKYLKANIDNLLNEPTMEVSL